MSATNSSIQEKTKKLNDLVAWFDSDDFILEMALDKNDEVIGYKFVRVGKMLEDIRNGEDPKTAYEKNIGTYGRFA